MFFGGARGIGEFWDLVRQCQSDRAILKDDEDEEEGHQLRTEDQQADEYESFLCFDVQLNSHAGNKWIRMASKYV